MILKKFLNTIDIYKFDYKSKDGSGISFVIEDEIEKDLPYKRCVI